ncbi:TniB family NTP-binding protein [Kordiimonas sp. SCSIO 12603]|uniref:TniB family NTP-binding protein n=1 Tax=Kordiimonas sp. SCSIO 12603 TaxID=2829596 RepID=UPI00210336F8|nr:TniB family NTP-binding protein [Kordiimonas sp. SCSIO 12603]UTW59037.1 TniB family NTP-binding protein [Kordiimonas sp. SCSIO 12603]
MVESEKHTHLHPKIRHLATAGYLDRETAIENDHWLGYPIAKKAIEKMQALLRHPDTHRMPNLIIYGPSNNGKTKILEKFLRDHPPSDNVEGDSASYPVMYIQMPIVADPKRFYIAILEKLFAPYRPTDNTIRLETQAIRLLKACGLKMLIIDEFHNMLGSRLDIQRQFLNLIRYLGNELKVPIVAAGTKSAVRALQIDEQLANRFEPLSLPYWSFDKNYRTLLAGIEAIIPLKLSSKISSESLSKVILSMSEGTIGETFDLVRLAAIHAINTNREKIDETILKSCGYIPPSERRKAAEKI